MYYVVCYMAVSVCVGASLVMTQESHNVVAVSPAPAGFPFGGVSSNVSSTSKPASDRPPGVARFPPL